MCSANPIDRHKRRLEKFRRDQVHFKYLQNKGYNSLDMADRLIHNMLETLYFGLKIQYPEVSEQELKMKLRQIALQDMKIKTLAKKAK